MTDINPDVPDKPIEVPQSPVSAQVGSGGRDILLLVAALPALIAVLGTRDVKQIVDWFAGQQGLAFIGLALAIGTPIWRQWIARRKHANDVKLVSNVDDRIGKVK